MQLRKNELEEYENLRNSITKIFAKYDPIGIAYESNPDEYDLEAKTILRKLDRCNSVNDVTNIVYQDFKSWFFPDVIGERNNYIKISDEIWNLWNSSKIYKRLNK